MLRMLSFQTLSPITFNALKVLPPRTQIQAAYKLADLNKKDSITTTDEDRGDFNYYDPIDNQQRLLMEIDFDINQRFKESADITWQLLAYDNNGKLKDEVSGGP